ncbi:hypothetical protein [Crocosphaera sp. Alani8]|uniref:hypothetical protein n=1 Tax=Crocosphaera sp. Alani8 TaxID=3038952 RepID=UPI00313C1D62
MTNYVKLKTITIFMLILSVLFNLSLLSELIGRCEVSNGRIGVLTQDIEIGHLKEKTTVFTLPKGLTVREVSATRSDLANLYKFRFVITSNSESLIDYSNNKGDLSNTYSEYYSTKNKTK